MTDRPVPLSWTHAIDLEYWTDETHHTPGASPFVTARRMHSDRIAYVNLPANATLRQITLRDANGAPLLVGVGVPGEQPAMLINWIPVPPCGCSAWNRPHWSAGDLTTALGRPPTEADAIHIVNGIDRGY